MTYEQITLFALIVAVLIGLLWGRWRYDVVAFAALVAGLVLGVVPVEHAFEGFGHEATIVVALVLIISAGLSRSGAVDLITRAFIDPTRPLGLHIGITGVLGAALSAFMNNVAALALLMPVDLEAARKAGRSPARTLMPLSFATILGGMVTLIGTPPNIVIAAYRADAGGAPFGMFDFAPVGLIVAIAGLLFVALVGWRLIPDHVGGKGSAADDLLAIENYVAELVVHARSKAVDTLLRDLDPAAEEADCAILGLVRKGHRLPGRARGETVQAGDLLVVQGRAEDLQTLAGTLGLKMQGKSGQVAEMTADMELVEAVVTRDSRLVGRSANDSQLLRGHGLSLIGLSRQGRTQRERIRRTPLKPGDILLLLGPSGQLAEAATRLGTLPLADRALTVIRHEKAWGAIGLFAAAIALSAIGLLHLPVALAIVALGYVLFDILPVRDLYDTIEWPVIVLLGAMIPLGTALETSGGTAILADLLARATMGWPAWVAILVLMVVTMTLSDVLNNVATTVIAAPIAIELAKTLGYSADPFLMAVAIGASCAFLTPIGHKNNMLILGPGGYRFGDYWRMGLPLEALIVAVAVPAILIIWPL